MGGSVASLVLAHAGGGGVSESGQLVYTIMFVTVLAVIWILVGVVCWIFWRAKKRDDAERARTEVEWRNVPSS